jgi:fluoride exporter
MSVAVLLAVGALGGVGAIARFLLDGAVAARAASSVPVGTLVVNLAGSFLLGLFVGLTLGGDGYRILGTGLVGAFTTFSTWALESHRLGEDGELRLGAANFGVSLMLGVTVAWLGRALGGAL